MSDEYLYMTLNIYNPTDDRNNSDAGGVFIRNNESPLIASKDESINYAFLKQSDFDVAIHSFTINAITPIFICPIEEGINQTNRDKTNFIVCLRSAGSDFPVIVTYSSESSNSTLPNPPSQNNGVQQINNEYYYVYTFQHFIDLVNFAFQTAFTNMKTAQSALPQTESPYFVYNAETGLISLIVENSYDGGPQIFMNDLLFNYFEAIDNVFNGYNQTNGKDYQIVIDNKRNYNAYRDPTLKPNDPDPQYLEIKQEYDVRYKWSNIRSVIFYSDSIKTKRESIPSYSDPNLNIQSNLGYQPNYQNILSYHDIIYQSGKVSQREILQYNPFVYKWMSLISDEPLNRLQLRISFLLQNGIIIPFKIRSGDSSNIKLLFRKKVKHV